MYRRNGLIFVLIALGTGGLATRRSGAETIPLEVDWGGVVEMEAYPVRGGLPFARGVLLTAENVRLRQGEGEVPGQTRILATWPDGSVKWLLVDFLAKPGETYDLEYGPEVQRTTVPSLPVEETAAQIIVDTGVLRAVVRRDGSGFVDELAFDSNGDGRYEKAEQVVGPAQEGERRNFLDFVHLRDPSGYRAMSRTAEGTLDRSGFPLMSGGSGGVRVEELAVEERGPVRVALRLRGKYVHALAGSTLPGRTEPVESNFTVRLHFFRGQSFFVAEHTFLFEADPDQDFVRAFGLRLNTPTNPPTHQPTNPPTHTPTHPHTHTPTLTVSVGTDGTQTWEAAASLRAGLYQANADEYRVWRAAASPPSLRLRSGQAQGGEREEVVATGRRSNGWVDLSGEEWGLAVGIRHAWQLYPKSLHVDAAAGQVTAYLWPPEANLLDLRRYARDEYGVGEAYAYETTPGVPNPQLAEFSRVAARGVGRTHEVLFYFHRKDATGGDGRGRKGTAEGGDGRHDVSQFFQAFDRGPILKAPLACYADSGALGRYTPYAPGVYEEVWRAGLRCLDYTLHAQEHFRWYGMFDYGDIQSRYNYQRQGRWESDWGRWGWGQNDGIGRYAHAFWMQYLCTGERKYFEAAEASSRHGADVDIIHTDFPTPWLPRTKGLSHRHGVQHWSDTYTGLRGSTPLGYRLYYYLTGCERIKDVLAEVLDCAMSDYYGHSGDVNAHDGSGAAAMTLLTWWEMTGEEKYREKLAWKVATMPVPENSWHAGLMNSMGLFEAFVDYYALTGDPKAKEHLLKAGEFVAAFEPQPGQDWPYDSVRNLAEAYRLTGDAKYRERLEQIVTAFGEYLQRQPQLQTPPEDWPGGGITFELGNQPFNELRVLPYALAALQGGN